MSAQRIGVLGGGRQTRKNAVALLKDYIGSNEVEIYVVGAPFDDSSRFAADFGLMTGIPTSIFTTSLDAEDYDDYKDATFYEREDCVEALRTVLSRGKDSVLLFSFAETSEEEDLLKGFLSAGVQVLDFAEGLYPVVLEDDGSGEPEGEPVAETEGESPAEPVVTPETPTESESDPDEGLTPEAEPDTEPDTEPDEGQQPTQAPKRARAPRKAKEAPVVVDVNTDHINTAMALDPTIGPHRSSSDDAELLELGRAVKTLLDYLGRKTA